MHSYWRPLDHESRHGRAYFAQFELRLQLDNWTAWYHSKLICYGISFVHASLHALIFLVYTQLLFILICRARIFRNGLGCPVCDTSQLVSQTVTSVTNRCTAVKSRLLATSNGSPAYTVHLPGTVPMYICTGVGPGESPRVLRKQVISIIINA